MFTTNDYCAHEPESCHFKLYTSKEKHMAQHARAAAENIYVPSLWYYNRMRILEDQMEVRESLSTLPFSLPSTPAEASEDQPGPSILEEVEEPSWSQEDLSQDEALECGTQEEAGVSVSQEVVGPSRSLTQSQVPPLRLPTKRARKGSNVKEAAPGLIKEANVALKSPPNTKEAYGCYVAARLQQMEEGQCLRCEKIIFEAIHKELSGQISDNMHLVALAHPPPPPLATSPPPEPQPSRKAAGNRAGKAARKTRK
ncbi:hypothetical protein AB205_0022370 [Aquarana catesbeiana]|uniref:MADF domain-containing protein n=1 Tax=Aquarana catesbeiana TaxID=8400 RepID=A0A2G9QBA6_AQUCT|nr:hypothetical protein AB205_0022370 [Aquarana catesbeiana]